MKKRNKPYRPKAQHNPLALFGAKQLVGQEDADAIALPLMLHLDAAKRGECTDEGCHFMGMHLIAASLIAAATRSEAFHAQLVEAFGMLKKAAERPTKALDLTTGEYQSIKKAIAAYVVALPQVEVGVMAGAWKMAVERMGIPTQQLGEKHGN